MGASKKLQGEIDCVLRKVKDLVSLFSTTFNKVNESENLKQKKRLEDFLKSDFKKLQRYRDRIKTWKRSSEIKKKVNASYKQALMDSYKLIEKEMERFIIREKQAEAQSLSKEALEQQPKLDAKEKDKSQTTEWVNNTVSELESQIESFEAEMEGLSVKKGKSGTLRLDHLESSINQHKAHIEKLQLTLKMIDNDELSPEQVNHVKDLLDYYVERNQEDIDKFEDVDMLYSTLPLDKASATLLNKNEDSVQEQPDAPPTTETTQTTPVAVATGAYSVKGILDNSTSSVPSSLVNSAVKEEEDSNLPSHKLSPALFEAGSRNLGRVGLTHGVTCKSGGEQEKVSSSAIVSSASSVLNEDAIQLIISSLRAVDLFWLQCVCKDWEMRLKTLIAGSIKDLVFVVCCGFVSRLHLYNPTIGDHIQIPPRYFSHGEGRFLILLWVRLW